MFICAKPWRWASPLRDTLRRNIASRLQCRFDFHVFISIFQPPGGQYMSVRRRTLQSNVPKPHQCQICGSRFTRLNTQIYHLFIS